jgi:hypothetical protein
MFEGKRRRFCRAADGELTGKTRKMYFGAWLLFLAVSPTMPGFLSKTGLSQG